MRKTITSVRRMLPATLALVASLNPANAQSCNVDMAAVEDKIAGLEQTYGALLSDIACETPTIPAHQIMCDSADTSDATVWRMGRLNDLAWVYAYENATKTEIDPTNPPINDFFFATRDACTDEACLCDLFIQQTNDSLGGLTPYPQ
ncbi:MAG: hypothetical protein ACRCS3_05560 [Paracoccaceae bacterium]